jgi:hypothetical protein
MDPSLGRYGLNRLPEIAPTLPFQASAGTGTSIRSAARVLEAPTRRQQEEVQLDSHARQTSQVEEPPTLQVRCLLVPCQTNESSQSSDLARLEI